jgi:hypothetical protein
MKLANAKMWKALPKAVKMLSEEQELVVRRMPSGAYDSQGRWEDRDPETFKICASVQIAKSEELMKLEENRRTRLALKIYTTTQLQTGSVKNAEQPDIIEYKGDDFQVDFVDDWYEEGGYFKVIATKAGQ